MKPLGFECSIGRGELICTGEVQPLPVCRRYRVEIRLRAGDRPRARVISPALERRSPAEAIPHMWGPDEPCFYYPVAREWMPSMAIADSIVPWLGLWFIHYEGWRATGHWEGGGVSHGPRSSDRSAGAIDARGLHPCPPS